MRIAIIGVKGIGTSQAQRGGIERHVEILAGEMVKRGHQVTVYVRPYANPQGKKRWQGVKLITLPTIHSKHLDAIVHTFLASFHVLSQNVDIVHYHAVGPSLMSWVPRLFKPRAKVVATFHSRDQFNEKWNALARIALAAGEWTACTFPHLTIAVSHGIQLFCQKMFGRDAIYIPNGVEVPSRPPGTSYLKALGLKPGEYMITLGRLIPLKAHDDAIRALKHLDTKKRLLIIGDALYDEAGYHADLEELARQDPRVVLMGYRSGEELRQLIAHSYCMIHPSRVEGLSVAILEAMSFGRLVVMSDIPANRELVDHSGIAYPVGNIKALADTLRWALNDPILVKIRGERARDVVRRLYSWQYVVDRTEHELKRLLQTAPSTRYEDEEFVGDYPAPKAARA